MGTPKILGVAFDCFDTRLRITEPKNPWRSLLAEASWTPGAQRLDPRREPIATIEEFAEACGVAFRSEWHADLEREFASIERMPDALAVLSSLRTAGFRLALARNHAPTYVEPALTLLGDCQKTTHTISHQDIVFPP